MKAIILAAGLGTRLRPWTLEHPKALVPVGGVPMLERVILRLREEGFDEIIVNIHHFGDQIIDFLQSKDYGIKVGISDERGCLLDTGGGVIRAGGLLGEGPVLVHNVDILSNAALKTLMRKHEESSVGGSLLVSDRESSRKLIFDNEMILKGWHNSDSGQYRPDNYLHDAKDKELAFSGIYVTSGEMRREMLSLFGYSPFPIMDYFLSKERREIMSGVLARDLNLIDIGKPATLKTAQSLW